MFSSFGNQEISHLIHVIPFKKEIIVILFYFHILLIQIKYMTGVSGLSPGNLTQILLLILSTICDCHSDTALWFELATECNLNSPLHYGLLLL